METLVRDPLLTQAEFPLTSVFYPLGFPLRFRTNSEHVLAAAKESWGAFSCDFPLEEAEFLAGVNEDGSEEMPPVPVYRSRKHLLSLIADGHNFGVCDLKEAFSYAWFNPAAARHPSYVRHFFLDAIGYTLISHRHLAPVHAACVALQGRGFLFCGSAGAGKSTLAFACARRGWDFISDDSSFVVRRLNDRTIIGNPYKMRFRPSATALFPELADRVTVFAPNGKPTIEVPTSEFPFVRTARAVPVEHVLFLSRREGATAALIPFSREAAFEELQQVVFFGEERVRELQRAALHRLLSGRLYEFIYDDLDSAIDRLERLLEQGEAA